MGLLKDIPEGQEIKRREFVEEELKKIRADATRAEAEADQEVSRARKAREFTDRDIKKMRKE